MHNDLILTKNKYIIMPQEQLQEIDSWMPEVSRASTFFKKRNSQTTTSLMSLNMIDIGPYRVLRQIIAQVETKRQTLVEVIYKLKMKDIKIRKLQRELSTETDELEQEEIQLKISKLNYDISNTQGNINAVLKEIGSLKRRYEEILKNKHIRPDWNEHDFEKSEIEHHIKMIFRNAIRDRLQGPYNMGTMEYMEQYGLNPITAYSLVDDYIAKSFKLLSEIKDKGFIDVNEHYDFYERMYQLFKNEYKKSMKQIGLDSILFEDFLNGDKNYNGI